MSIEPASAGSDQRRGHPRSMGVVVVVAFLTAVLLANWLIDNVGIVPVGFGLTAPAGERLRELRQRWGVDNDPATTAAADTIIATMISDEIVTSTDPRVGLEAARARPPQRQPAPSGPRTSPDPRRAPPQIHCKADHPTASRCRATREHPLRPRVTLRIPRRGRLGRA